MSVASSSVLQECTVSSFRVPDLLQVDVEVMGRKKVFQLHSAV